jgi:hypothetical protein
MVDSLFWVQNGVGSNPASLIGKMAEWSKAIDCKSIPFNGSEVQILFLPF